MRKYKASLKALSSRGSVITRAVATNPAKALIKQNPGLIADLDLESSAWAQSLYRRMGYVRRRHTTTKVDIPDAARKEIEYVNTLRKNWKRLKIIQSIPNSIVINFDQTPLKIVPCSKSTMAEKNISTVCCCHWQTIYNWYVCNHIKREISPHATHVWRSKVLQGTNSQIGSLWVSTKSIFSNSFRSF